MTITPTTRSTFIPGPWLFFFSDGIIDAVNAEGDRFGEARFHKLVFDSRELSAEEIRDAVASAVLEFSRGRQQDDQTLIVIKRT